MRRLLAAALAATALLVVTPLHATATSPARMAAAVAMSREVDHRGVHGPAVDRALVLGAWHAAGVDTRGLDTADDLLHACTALDPTEPRPAGPAPGDYALYRDSAGVERVGMFLSQLDVAIVDGDAVTVLPTSELNGEIGQLAQARVVAQHGSFLACRLAPSRWPGGVDDTSIGAGRIALADPTEVSAQLDWAARHPRDADQGFWHPVQRILATLAVAVSEAVSSLVDSLVSAVGWLLHHAPWGLGAPFLFLAGLLGRSFDGRRLHAVLSGLVLAVGLGLGWVLPFGWVLLGAVLGGAAASAAGVPVLGAIGGALVGGALAVGSFLAGALTGVDGSARDTAGTVVFALLADLFMLRPALALIGSAGRLGRLGALAHAVAPMERLPVIRAIAGHGRSALDVAGTAGDALALRPNAIVQSAHNVRHGIAALRGARIPVEPHVLSEAIPLHHAMSAAEAMMSGSRRGLDLLSLAWRPSSVSSDLVGHAADALHLLDAELRTGLPSMPRLRALLTSMDPAVRKPLLDGVAHVSTHAVPQMRVTARLSHLHSGARTVMGIATHTQPQRPWTRLARSPIVRRTLRL
jgi:hypothetical protein